MSTKKVNEDLLLKNQVISALQDKLHQEERTTGFHFGLIADGNRRWAETQGLPKIKGHNHGYKLIKETIFPLVASIPQIKEFSIYLLSHKNMQRKKVELDNLFWLFNKGFNDLIEIAAQHNLSYKHAGDKSELPSQTSELLSKLEVDTAKNKGLIVNLCINYDAQMELGHALKSFLIEFYDDEKGEDKGKKPDQLQTDKLIKEIQKRSWIPSPIDAVIRTGGDPRFSGFLGNRVFDSNCHLLLEEKFLPALTENDILRHLWNFATHQRRMGK